jgi:copper chaperone NosL
MNSRTMRTILRNMLAALAATAALAACSHPAARLAAQEPGDDTACAVDGMLLKDFPGPKAQVHYAEGKPDFYCDMMDLFSALLAPEQKRATAAVFVQDMGKTSWEHPSGNWIDAKSAFYVAGSRKQGSMGPTFGTFSRSEDAQSFVAKEGGRVLRFDEITLAMLQPDKHMMH